jgi:hypothetical protein
VNTQAFTPTALISSLPAGTATGLDTSPTQAWLNVLGGSSQSSLGSSTWTTDVVGSFLGAGTIGGSGLGSSTGSSGSGGSGGTPVTGSPGSGSGGFSPQDFTGSSPIVGGGSPLPYTPTPAVGGKVTTEIVGVTNPITGFKVGH